MVEFGLKLEDNRVAEWSDQYIDYQKLKLLIDKAIDTIKKREELEKRNPSKAEEIKENFSYSQDYDFRTPRTSVGSLTSLVVEVKSDGSGHDNEKTALLSGSGSGGGSSPKTGMKRTNSYSTIQEALTNVANYFKPGTFEDKLRHLLNSEVACKHRFNSALEDEMKKVELFYNFKCQELREQLNILVQSIPDKLTNKQLHKDKKFSKAQQLVNKVTQSFSHKEVKQVDEESVKPSSEGNESFNAKQADSIKRAIIDLHRNAKLLLNFAILNYTGFVKITKKYEKKVTKSKGAFKDILDTVNKDGKSAEELADEMELKFAIWFCGGNVREAQVQMLPKRGDNLDMDWSQLRLGYRLGMCAILTLWVCWDCIWGLVADGNSTIGGRTAFPVFRGVGGLLVFHWFWGFSTFIWSRYRVNYIFLFDFDPRIIDTPITILNDVVDETLVFLILMLLYYKAGTKEIPMFFPSGVYPFLLILYTIKKLILPLKTRKPLWTSISAVISSPLNSPTFFTTYVGDVFTSMVKVFQDLLWIICFVVSGDFLLSEDDQGPDPHAWQDSFWYKHVAIPLICLAPLWFRFNQCLRRYMDTGKRLPHLANSFKYALSQTVTLFGAFHPLYLLHYHKKDNMWGTDLFQLFWMGLFVTSSLYSWFWDVYVDWGLGRVDYAFLGPRLMFPKKLHYYSVIFADLFLRFMWVLTLVPPQSGAKFELPNYLNAITMIVELFRRTLWSFFRLENEHRCNTSQFRRVDFVPLHFDTGHNHKYKQKAEERGWTVLAEVLAVSIAVIAVSVSSIIAAQNATENIEVSGFV